MRALPRLVAFALMGFLPSLPLLGADDKDKKTDPPKNDVKKTDVKKTEPAKKDEPAKKNTDKKDNGKKTSVPKMQSGSLLATVVAIVENKKSLRLRVKVPYFKQNNGKVQLAEKDQEVEWTAADDVKVRMANPPPQFDDKGRIKRYTAKELRELRGKEKYYPAEFSDLKTGQIVQVTVLQKKTASRAPKRGKGAEGELSADNLPKISFILILVEPKN